VCYLSLVEKENQRGTVLSNPCLHINIAVKTVAMMVVDMVLKCYKDSVFLCLLLKSKCFVE